MGGEAGKTLAGRYRLRSVAGAGSMGRVWRARDGLLDRDVAVKEVRFPARLAECERRAACRRVMAEARATAALRHPGVVTVYDVVLEDGRPWIVMELVPARTLREVIARDGPLSPRRAAEVGLGVLSVLRAAHAAGIMHRDVKPGNVLIAADGRVMLTDFGLAVRMERGCGLADTMVHGIQGTPAYLSPEQVRGEPGGVASDLWSLGATLYAAVEGNSPYLRSHALASLVAVLLAEYEPAAHATPALRQVIDGLLRHDPAERMDARRAYRLLAEAAAEPPVPRARRRRMPRAATVAGVTVLAATMITAGTWTARWDAVSTSDTVMSAMRPLAAETVSYQEPDGYAVEVPSGWVRARRPDGVHWDDPGTRRHLRIRQVSGDALKAFRAAERAVKAGGGYRRLRLERAPEVADGAVEWEFVLHTMNKMPEMHGLRSRIGAYEFSFTAPEDRWTPGHRLYEMILRTFRPGN